MSKAELVHIVAALSTPRTDAAMPLPQWDPILQRWVLVIPVPPNEPEPQPDWSKAVTQTVIDRALAQQRLALTLGDGTASGTASAAIRAEVAQFVDELCTEPPAADLPSFSSLAELAEPAPADLLRAGAQFQTAADLLDGQPLRAEFTAAADRLFGTALKRINATAGPNGAALDAKHEGLPAFVPDAKHESVPTFSPDAKHESAPTFSPDAKHESAPTLPADAKHRAVSAISIASVLAKHESALAGHTSTLAKHEAVLAKHEAILAGLTSAHANAGVSANAGASAVKEHSDA